MTQSTNRNGYTLTTMDSTDVYNYMKRIARKGFATNCANVDSLAEAIIESYGDDCAIDTRELKAVCLRPGFMTQMDFRTMECDVTTSMSFVPVYEAHVD